MAVPERSGNSHKHLTPRLISDEIEEKKEKTESSK
jgi:hypothetical protein